MAEKAGKIRSLLVRPFRSADIAFNMAGVIDLHNQDLARLGMQVQGFLLQQLYTDIETEVNSHAAVITFTADEIRRRLEEDTVTDPAGPPQNHVFFSLRNESLRASLEQAILRRDNAFRDRYQFRDKIARYFSDIYKTDDWGTPSDPNLPDTGEGVDPDQSTDIGPKSKVGRLLTLQRACRDRFLKIRYQYNFADNQNAGVAISTDTDTKGRARNVSESFISLALGSRANQHTTDVDQATTPENPDQTLTHKEADSVPLRLSSDGAGKLEAFNVVPELLAPAASGTVDNAGKLTNLGVLSNRSVSRQFGISRDPNGAVTETGEGTVVQTSTTKHRTYTFPRRDNDEEFQRTQLSLQDEILDEKITTLGVPEITQIMTNELEMMDWEINKLQLNYAHTYLVPPFDGIVTAVYKDLGESVVAGEPVLRVEDHSHLMLVGRVQFRGVLRLDDPLGAGGKVRIRTTSLFEDGQVREFTNVKIVSIRGHNVDNDEYDLILECENPLIDPADASKGRLLPINYHFDRDDTEIFFDA